MNIYIREARPEDAQAIIEIFNPIIKTAKYTVFDTPFSVEEEQSYIENLPPRGIFHVAIQTGENKVVGFQSMEPFASYTAAFDHVGVLGTYVDLLHRRMGIATRLFKATFELARQKGYKKIFTYIRADNPAALATYLSQGFRQVGIAEKQACIQGQFIDEIIIEKWL